MCVEHRQRVWLLTVLPSGYMNDYRGSEEKVGSSLILVTGVM